MYRSAPLAAPKLTPEAGIVDDMVRQFADRHAFLRELVQNGIDAGATRIDVRVEQGPDGAVRTSVADDGTGMTRAIIEGPLLTLFESSKESDPTKIGKYGVGFVSVFAIEPERVEVRTRTAHESWLVKLFGDHSFELSAAPARHPDGGGARTGTEVSLFHTMSGEAFTEHAAQAGAALLRWCRHAHLPVTFATSGQGDGATSTINAPLTLPGVAAVAVSERDERFVVAIGAGRDDEGHGSERSATFGGFYNRGLTLMEGFAPEEGLHGLRFKVDSPRLSHTLSRDSVRRDAELRRVLGRVRDLVDRALWPELRARLAEAADGAALGDATAYLALLEAAQHPRFTKYARDLTVPLVSPFEGRRTLTVAELHTDEGRPVLVADQPSALTQAALARCWPVVRHVALAPQLRTLVPVPVGVASEVLAFASTRDVPESPEDRALLDGVVGALSAAGRASGRARLARFEGAASDVMWRLVQGADDEAVAMPEEALEQSWGPSRAVFFNVEHVNVRLARRRARTDAGIAAHLLTRALLIAEGPLSARVVDRLLASAATGRAP